MTISQIMLAQNNSHFPGAELYLSNPAKGVTMHKIPPEMADDLADTFTKNVSNFPVPYALACMCIEALFDPNCVNGNLMGSNKQNDPLGYDMGMCQLKLKYLPTGTLEERKAFAFDPNQAIPYFVRTMQTNVSWASTQIGSFESDVFEDFRNPYFLATCAYNFGKVGILEMITTKEPLPTHGIHVRDLERTFAKELGLVSVFP